MSTKLDEVLNVIGDWDKVLDLLNRELRSNAVLKAVWDRFDTSPLQSSKTEQEKMRAAIVVLCAMLEDTTYSLMLARMKNPTLIKMSGEVNIKNPEQGKSAIHVPVFQLPHYKEYCDYLEQEGKKSYDSWVREKYPEATKPPLGLRPRRVFLEDRLKEIEEAVGRYEKANKEIPGEWWREKHDILQEFNRPLVP